MPTERRYAAVLVASSHDLLRATYPQRKATWRLLFFCLKKKNIIAIQQ